MGNNVEVGTECLRLAQKIGVRRHGSPQAPPLTPTANPPADICISPLHACLSGKRAAPPRPPPSRRPCRCRRRCWWRS